MRCGVCGVVGCPLQAASKFPWTTTLLSALLLEGVCVCVCVFVCVYLHASLNGITSR